MTASQLSLFAAPTSRRTDPVTSRKAAMSVLPMVGSIENRILERFAIHGPMTDETLVRVSPQWHGPTLCTARSRLSKRGLLIPDGVETNSRGREMTRWRLP